MSKNEDQPVRSSRKLNKGVQRGVFTSARRLKAQVTKYATEILKQVSVPGLAMEFPLELMVESFATRMVVKLYRDEVTIYFVEQSRQNLAGAEAL